MEIQSAFNAGLEGFIKASETANEAAKNIASQTAFRAYESESNHASLSTEATQFPQHPQKPPNILQSVVDLKVAEHQAKASAAVIKTADEALGKILDVRV